MVKKTSTFDFQRTDCGLVQTLNQRVVMPQAHSVRFQGAYILLIHSSGAQEKTKFLGG